MVSFRSFWQWQPIVSKTYVLALYQSTTCRIKTKKLDMDKKKSFGEGFDNRVRVFILWYNFSNMSQCPRSIV